MFIVPIKTSNGKTTLCEAKYPTEKQARYARFTLINIVNSARFVPVDHEINESGEKFIIHKGKCYVGEIVEVKNN